MELIRSLLDFARTSLAISHHQNRCVHQKTGMLVLRKVATSSKGYQETGVLAKSAQSADRVAANVVHSRSFILLAGARISS